MKDELETYLEYFDEVELVKECDGYFYNVHDMLKETLIKGLTPFNSVSLLFLNVQYNKVEFWTFAKQ